VESSTARATLPAPPFLMSPGSFVDRLVFGVNGGFPRGPIWHTDRRLHCLSGLIFGLVDASALLKRHGAAVRAITRGLSSASSLRSIESCASYCSASDARCGAAPCDGPSGSAERRKDLMLTLLSTMTTRRDVRNFASSFTPSAQAKSLSETVKAHGLLCP